MGDGGVIDFWQILADKIGVDNAIAAFIFAIIMYLVLEFKDGNESWFKFSIMFLAVIPVISLLIYPLKLVFSIYDPTFYSSPAQEINLIDIIILILFLSSPLIYYRDKFGKPLARIIKTQKTMFSEGMVLYALIFAALMSIAFAAYIYGIYHFYQIMLLNLGATFIASAFFYYSFKILLYLTHATDAFVNQWKKTNSSKILGRSMSIFFVLGILISYLVLFPQVTPISKDVTSVEIIDYRYNNYNSEKRINEPITSLTNNTGITYEIKPKYLKWILFDLREQIESELTCAPPYNSHVSCKIEKGVATILFSNESKFNVTFSGKSRAYISSDVALIENKSKNEYGLSISNSLPFKVERNVIGVEVNSKCTVTNYTYYIFPAPSEYFALDMGTHSIKDFSSREIISTIFISAVRDGNVTYINAIDVPPMSNLTFSFSYVC